MAPAPPDHRIDATGLRCPLPVLKLEAALRSLPPGARILLRTDDPISKIDVPHAARSGGHACALVESEGGVCVVAVTRDGEARPVPPGGCTEG